MSKKLELMRLEEKARWAKLTPIEKVLEVIWEIFSGIVGLLWNLFCKEVKKEWKRR